MRHLALLVGAATAGAVCLAPCTAQIVSPQFFAGAEAPSSGTGPFGQSSTTGWRYQQIHDDFDNTPRTIRSLAVRRDSSATQNYNSYTARLTLLLSNAAVASSAINTNFDANHGTNRVTVANDRLVTFPSTRPGGAPAPFLYSIPFDAPYSYSGNGSTCWEVRVTSHSNMLTSYSFDAAANASTNPALGVAVYGFGCRHSSRISPISATGTSGMNWPAGAGTLYLDGHDLPDSSQVTVVLGFSKSSYSGLVLPFLMPGSLSAPSGPCALFAAADLSFGVTTTGTSARLALPIPAMPTLHGGKVYGQYLAFDPLAGHPLSVVGSNGVEYCWIGPHPDSPVSQVYATNVFAPTGTTRTSFGYVVQLR